MVNLVAPLLLLLSAASFAQTNNTLRSVRHDKSPGGQASCLSGLLSLSLASANRNLLLSEPSDSEQLSSYVLSLLSANSTFAASTDGGPRSVSGAYDLHVTLCTPLTNHTSTNASASRAQTIQLLTHGLTVDASYWSTALGHSYVDTAASHGFATLRYDRLGTGLSSKPDPIATLQAALDREVLHTLSTGLKDGSLPHELGTWKRVVAIGHSYGSSITSGLASAHPDALDGVVLTGFSTNATGLSYVLGLLNASPASSVLSSNPLYNTLSSGYFSSATFAGNQVANLYYPHYNSTLAHRQWTDRSPISIGQFLTQNELLSPSTFAGPIGVFNGHRDFGFCTGDCMYPTDLGLATLDALYPQRRAGSRAEMFEDVGHFIDVHYGAETVWEGICAFLGDVGF